MQKTPYDITIFLAINSILLAALIGFIVSIIILYKKRQLQLQKNLDDQNGKIIALNSWEGEMKRVD